MIPQWAHPGPRMQRIEVQRISNCSKHSEIGMWGFKKNWRLTSSIGANEEAPCPRVKLERESAYEGFLTRVRELQAWLFHYILLLCFPWISHAHQTPEPQQLILSTEEQNRSACQQNPQNVFFINELHSHTVAGNNRKQITIKGTLPTQEFLPQNANSRGKQNSISKDSQLLQSFASSNLPNEPLLPTEFL